MTDIVGTIGTRTLVGATGKEPRIVTAKKEKDPRRGEAGKRLAAISTQAKERKKLIRERRELQHTESIESTGKKYMVILATVGVVVAVATLWYTMYPVYPREPPKKTEEHKEAPIVPSATHVPVVETL